MLVVYVMILPILWVALFDNDSSKSSNYEKETVQNIEYQQVSPWQLRKRLKENAARAKLQYQGMYVEFDGILENIDSNGGYFYAGSRVSCHIKDVQQKRILISKNEGDIVHVKGKITYVGDIVGYDVDIIELK